MSGLMRPHNPNFTLKSVIDRCKDAILQAFEQRDGGQYPMQVRLLSHNEKSLVLKISFGDKSGILKAFDLENPDTAWAFDREISVGRKLAKTELSGRLLKYSIPNRFAVFDFLDGTTLEDALHQGDPLMLARQLGAWYAEFSQQMPTRTVATDWLAYLRKYDEPALSEGVERIADVLQDMPITRLSIAKNDAFLRNFIVTPDQGLRGVDFETSALKPVGWDLLLAARVLAKAFPDQVADLTGALIDGWGPQVGDVPAEPFKAVCTMFAEQTAFEAVGQKTFSMDSIKSEYLAAQANDPNLPAVTQVVRVPFGTERLAKTTAANRRGLADALLAEAEQAVVPSDQAKQPPRPILSDAAQQKHDPNPLLRRACAVCQGRCCTAGRRFNGFLTVHQLRRQVQRNPGITAQEIVDKYVSYLPDQHVAQGCLFHSNRGCTIPRQDRSDICNLKWSHLFGQVCSVSKVYRV